MSPLKYELERDLEYFSLISQLPKMKRVHLQADREDFIDQPFGVFAQPHGGCIVLGWTVCLYSTTVCLGKRLEARAGATAKW